MNSSKLIVLLALLLFGCSGNTQSEMKKSKSDLVTPNKITKGEVVSYQNLNKADFKLGLEENPNAILIDVRTPAETSKGKIENAIEIDFRSKEFMSQIESLDKNKAYYLYCRSGNRSEKTARIMAKNGFKEVYNLAGGYLDWVK